MYTQNEEHFFNKWIREADRWKMDKSESVQEFLERQVASIDKSGQCYVFDRKIYDASPASYRRRDFYKIMIIDGTVRFHYADKGILVDKPAMLFSNPMIPYSCEFISEQQAGYFCIFTEEFYGRKDHSSALRESPLFSVGSDPIYFVTPERQQHITQIFQTMIREFAGDYEHKFDVLRNYVSVLEHEAMKLQPSRNYFQHQDASGRITEMFVKLLERQFPIDSPLQTLELTTPADYAQYLSVHVNHLNRAVKSVTGKTTTEHIDDRILNEAKLLLKNTNWTISEIAYSLGYEYPSYFSNKFKKHTGTSPSSLRWSSGLFEYHIFLFELY